jgi:hypothetical protein
MRIRNHTLSSRGINLLVALTAALAVLSFTVIFATGGGSADAAKARPSAAAAVLGGADTMPDPACPLNCLVIPSVSGMQTVLPSASSPYRIPANGKITAWKIFLGKPTAKDRAALNDMFGSPPQASISILQRVNTPGGPKYRLQRKSPVVGLNRYLGTVATFRLSQPLKAVKGQFVALTVPTWAPAFASGLPKSEYSWRASREPGKCRNNNPSTLNPQLLLGSKRFYACSFPGSRLLFTARIKFD